MSIFVRCNQWLRGQLWEQSIFWHKFLFHLISFVDFFRGTRTYSSVCMELRFLLLFLCRVLLLAVLNPSRTTQPYNPFSTSSSGSLCYSVLWCEGDTDYHNNLTARRTDADRCCSRINHILLRIGYIARQLKALAHALYDGLCVSCKGNCLSYFQLFSRVQSRSLLKL